MSNNRLQGEFKLDIERNFLKVIMERFQKNVWGHYKISILDVFKNNLKIFDRKALNIIIFSLGRVWATSHAEVHLPILLL